MCLTLCDPMDCSTPGFPVLHRFLEHAQTHACWVGDAIQPSRSLLPSSAFNLSQHQSLFQWVSSSHYVAKVLELQLQHESFQWIFRVDFLWDWLVWFPCCPRDSQKSSPAQQFKSINSSVLNLLHGLALTSIHNTGRNIALTVAAAAAKLLQSCPTLCDPIDGSSPGSPVPGILQARTLEWVAISFSNEWKWKVKVKSLSRVQRPHGL